VTRWRRRRAARAQALVELALVLPILLALFVGVATAATFVSDAEIAGQAARDGARLAAEEGNAGYASGQGPVAGTCMTSGTDPCVIDQQVIESVLSVTHGLSDVAQVDEIDIYEPCAYPGQPCSAGGPDTEVCAYTAPGLDGSLYEPPVVAARDPVDVYLPNGSGGFRLVEPAGDSEYTLDLRSQAHPDESPIGVRVVYTFHASTPLTLFNFQTSEYATMCLAPSSPGG
jgi:hypothetical protein